MDRHQKEKERNVRRLDKEKEKKEIFDQRQEIRQVKRSRRRIRMPETTSSKKYVRFILGNCTAVEVYSMTVMWAKDDLSALYTLIGAVVTEGFLFAVYAAKAYKETEQEELIKLERDKLDLGMEEDTEPDREAAMG